SSAGLFGRRMVRHFSWWFVAKLRAVTNGSRNGGGAQGAEALRGDGRACRWMGRQDRRGGFWRQGASGSRRFDAALVRPFAEGRSERRGKRQACKDFCDGQKYLAGRRYLAARAGEGLEVFFAFARGSQQNQRRRNFERSCAGSRTARYVQLRPGRSNADDWRTALLPEPALGQRAAGSAAGRGAQRC